MEMEIDASKETETTATDLFKAAESGDASLFHTFSSDQLSNFLSLRNEDGRSLLHVATSSAHSKVPFDFFAFDFFF